MKPFKYAIFDFDGVVADTESVFADFDCDLLNDVLKKSGKNSALIPAEVRLLAGNGGEKKLQIIAERFGFASEDHENAFTSARTQQRKTLFRDRPVSPGQNLRTFLSLLDDKSALATNKVSAKLFHDMDLMGIRNLFSIIVPCDPPLKKKPEPDLLLEAASQLNADPKDCIYIGDNVLDMQAATAACMQAIGFVIEGKNGHKDRIDELERNGAALVIDDFTELQPYLVSA